MEEEPILSLIHTFVFKKKNATYSIEFYRRFLIINEIKTSQNTKINYSKIFKFKLSSKFLKIILQTNEVIKIPCTISELKKLQKLFKKNMQFLPNKKRYAAFVEFGETFFFIKIKSNDLDTLKSEIIKKIAKYFYPALDQEIIFLNQFEKFIIQIRKNNKLILIENSQDLDAVLLYFNYKIDIVFGYKK